MARVLAGDEAVAAINKMKTNINQGLDAEIKAIIDSGRTLSQPDVWDGDLAIRFRNEWPNTSRQLEEAKAELERLNQQIDQISKNILSAGGNQ